MGYKKELFYKDGEFVMTFGKHKGEKLEDIAVSDPSYIHWLHDNVFKVKTWLLKLAIDNDTEGKIFVF